MFVVQKLIINKIIPKIKYETLTTIKSITINDGVNNFKIVNPSMNEMTIYDVKYICNQANIPFSNQNIGGLLNELQVKFFKPVREYINDETRKLILQEQNNKCNSCHCILKEKEDYELDHIKPVSNGGTNDRKNLNILCNPCHKEKSSNERSEYIKQDNFLSTLNIEATKILHSNFSKKIAFSHYLMDEKLKDFKYHFNDEYLKGIQSIDINGSRRNKTKYSKYDFCKYSILDSWETYDGGKIQDGNYYIETDDYGLFHKNGIYSRPIIEYGLSIGVITKNNIKNQFLPSSHIDKSYFENFIDYIWDLFKPTDKQKLAINSWIGTMGRRNSRFIQCDYAKKDDKDKLCEIYSKFTNPHTNDYGDILTLTDEVKVEKLETNYYIYSQVLDEEAVELHKLLQKIKNVGGSPICLKTDCVLFYHNEKQPLNIENEFWDEEKTILKYKYEIEPTSLRNEIYFCCIDKLKFQNNIYNEYKPEQIYKDDAYENIINDVITSNKGCLILGPAGTGKSYLIKKMCKKLEDTGKKILRLAPTNKSARIICGQTLDKYCYKIL